MAWLRRLSGVFTRGRGLPRTDLPPREGGGQGTDTDTPGGTGRDVKLPQVELDPEPPKKKQSKQLEKSKRSKSMSWVRPRWQTKFFMGSLQDQITQDIKYAPEDYDREVDLLSTMPKEDPEYWQSVVRWSSGPSSGEVDRNQERAQQAERENDERSDQALEELLGKIDQNGEYPVLLDLLIVGRSTTGAINLASRKGRPKCGLLGPWLIVAQDKGLWNRRQGDRGPEDRMGQPVQELDHSKLTTRPSRLTKDQTGWASPSALHRAQELQYQQAGVSALYGFSHPQIEHRPTKDWKFQNAGYRVTFSFKGRRIVFYARNVDLCEGLGVDLKSPEDKFASPEKRTQLYESGLIVGGGAFYQQPFSCSGLHILGVGGGAIGAWVMRMAAQLGAVRCLWSSKKFDKPPPALKQRVAAIDTLIAALEHQKGLSNDKDDEAEFDERIRRLLQHRLEIHAFGPAMQNRNLGELGALNDERIARRVSDIAKYELVDDDPLLAYQAMTLGRDPKKIVKVTFSDGHVDFFDRVFECLGQDNKEQDDSLGDLKLDPVIEDGMSVGLEHVSERGRLEVKGAMVANKHLEQRIVDPQKRGEFVAGKSNLSESLTGHSKGIFGSVQGVNRTVTMMNDREPKPFDSKERDALFALVVAALALTAWQMKRVRDRKDELLDEAQRKQPQQSEEHDDQEGVD